MFIPRKNSGQERSPDEERKCLLTEAIDYINGAIFELHNSHRKLRIARLYSLFLRPIAFVMALLMSSLLALSFYFMLNWSGSVCFALGVVCYMLPLMAQIWWARGERDLQTFWAEVHRSDEVIAQLGDRELLLWPSSHPEEAWEDGATYQYLEQSLLARREQLQNTGDITT
jgi:hypothetical protein